MSFFTRAAGHPCGTARPRPFRPALELLEGREVPVALVGLTTAGSLIRFDSGTPGTLVGSPVTVTGLAAGETLVGIDYRPATGTLFGVGSTSRVYTINVATGVAAAVGGTAFTPALSGTNFGVNFNPTVDRLRVIGNTGQSLRINPDTGLVVGGVADTSLFYDPNDDTNRGFFGTTDPADPSSPADVPGSVTTDAIAYTRNGPTGNVTTLYAIDIAQDLLVRVGGPDGTPSPNLGQVVAVGELRTPAFTLVNFGTNTSFDIQAGTDAAFAVNGSTVYSLNLTTGTVTSLGVLGGGFTLSAVSVIPPAAGAGVLSLAASDLAFSAARTPIAVTVTRTGGASGPVTVNYATADGTGVAGVDYLPASGTVSFADGATSATIFLLLPAGVRPPSPARTFTLTLSNPTGGATLGAITAATVTIPEVVGPTVPPPPGVPPPPPPFRLFAAGSTGGRVAAYNAVGGAPLLTFAAFEGAFGGAVVVSTGDLNGDGFDDVIVGAGPGGGPRIEVYDGKALSAGTRTVIANFFAFEPVFQGGLSLASGDLNGDGFDDVIVGAGPGGGPRVQAFDGLALTAGTQTVLVNFFAFEPVFRGGVNVGAGEFTGDGFDDVIVGAGMGGGPRVQVLDGRSLAPVTSYFAYDIGFRGGIYVASGDVNGDGRLDVVVGAGPGGGPDVRAFSGLTDTRLGGFFAFDAALRGGVPVATADLNVDGRDEILVGSGADGASTVRVFNFAGASAFADLRPFGTSAVGGVFVG